MCITKEKNPCSECDKKVLYADPQYFDKPKPEPGPTYNSATRNKAMLVQSLSRTRHNTA